MREFLRGSQGKPIEARLANHHIKYLHGTAWFRTRRGGGETAGVQGQGQNLWGSGCTW